jgi:hypothetical protein
MLPPLRPSNVRPATIAKRLAALRRQSSKPDMTQCKAITPTRIAVRPAQPPIRARYQVLDRQAADGGKTKC